MMLRHAVAALLTLCFAPSALALDAIDLTEPLPAPAPGECPLLVKIKYPFLSCGEGDGGRALIQAKPYVASPSWASARQIPLMSNWTESDGAWGPDLNQD